MADPAPLTPTEATAPAEQKFREFLEIRGEKLTEPRRILIRHIFDSHKHFDAEDLVRELHDTGRRVSRSTVYRTLRLLVEAGLLRELKLTNRAVFEHDYGYPSHDHLHCSECGTIVEFNNDEIRRLQESIALEHGFRPESHRFIITGRCPSCSRARAPRRRLDLI